MKKNSSIALHTDPYRVFPLLLLYIILSLVFIFLLSLSVSKDIIQLNSLLKSGYDYSVTSHNPTLENDYLYFDAGIEFTLSVDSKTSMNADIIMQSNVSIYNDLVYWNADPLSTSGIAISNNLAKKNSLQLGDKLYSKHIVNGEQCKYTIEQIIPDALYVRQKSTSSNGIIIMGYDARYVENITHKYIFFTNDSIETFSMKFSDTPKEIIYRDDEIKTVILNIVPYLFVFIGLSIALSILMLWLLVSSMKKYFKWLIQVGFDMIRLNRSFYMHTIGLCMIPILFVLILSFSVFLMINASVTSILIIISLPFIETITIILASLIANKRLWRK